MHLVYRAIEKEPVPPTLPQSLIPPSKLLRSNIPSTSAPSQVSKPNLPGAYKLTFIFFCSKNIIR